MSVGFVVGSGVTLVPPLFHFVLGFLVISFVLWIEFWRMGQFLGIFGFRGWVGVILFGDKTKWGLAYDFFSTHLYRFDD